jgi:raffinose/stachyose/melibiose transport system substrate-binding protein
MKHLRLSVILIFCLLFTGVLSAQDGMVTLTWWVETTNQELLDHLQATLVQPFEAAHPEINLEITGQESLQDVLRTALLGGAAPDILSTFGPSWNAEYIAGGFMEPLNAYAEQYGWQDKLLPWAYATGTVNDTLYSIPLTYESIIMFYNKTLFDTNGWTVPTNRAELETVANAAMEQGIHPFTYGNLNAVWANGHILSAYLNNYVEQADLHDALVGDKQWTEPVFAEAIALLTDDIANKGWWSGGLENYYQYEGADYWAELASGEAAMMIIGTWGFQDAPTYFAETGNEWDWAPVPNMNETPRPSVYPLAIGSTLALNASSEHKDEAAMVFDFLISSPENVLNISAGFNYTEWLLPLHFTPDDFPEGVDPRVQSFHAEFASATAEGNYGYANWTFWPGPANTHLRVEIEGVWEGLTTIDDYLAAHQEVWNELFASGNTIPVP